MDRLGCPYLPRPAVAFQRPGKISFPCLVSALDIGLGIFKITILHQLGIQTAVGSIIDVLKKDTDQFITDLLRPARIYLDCGFKRFQALETHFIVPRQFSVECGPICCAFYSLYHALHSGIRYLEYLSVHRLPVHKCLLRHRRINGSIDFARLAEMIKIFGNGFVHPAILGLEHYLISSRCRVVRQHRSDTTVHPLHIRIVLRLPFYQIGTVSHGKLVGIIVHLEHATPRPVRHLYQIRMVHFLFRSPCSEVALNESMAGSNPLPHLPVRTPSKIQPTARMHIIGHEIHRIGNSRHSRTGRPQSAP